jgi:hypothetical protein
MFRTTLISMPGILRGKNLSIPVPSMVLRWGRVAQFGADLGCLWVVWCFKAFCKMASFPPVRSFSEHFRLPDDLRTKKPARKSEPSPSFGKKSGRATVASSLSAIPLASSTASSVMKFKSWPSRTPAANPATGKAGNELISFSF